MNNILIFILLIFSSRSWAQEEWKQVASWLPLGHRWALARDERGQNTAIYDLSSPDWSRRRDIATFGSRQLDIKALEETIRDTVKIGDGDIKAANAALDDLAALSQSHDLENLSQLESTLTLGLDGGQPALSPNYRTALEEVQNAIIPLEGEPFAHQFAGGFHLGLTQDRALQWQWSQVGGSGPRKVCDLKSIHWAFYQHIKLLSLHEAISHLASLANPGLAGTILTTAIDRFGHFYRLTLETQENMLLEALTGAKNGEEKFKDLKVLGDDLTKAIYSLSFSQISIENIKRIRKRWKDPEKEFAEIEKNLVKNEKENRAWLDSREIKSDVLNSRYAWTHGSQDQELLVNLAAERPKKKGPRVMIDYKNPNKIFRHRLLMEIQNASIVFGAGLVPILGGAIRFFYEHFVESPIDLQKVWEGRLRVNLEDASQQKWRFELITLDHQRLIPLLPNLDETEILIAERRALIGL